MEVYVVIEEDITDGGCWVKGAFKNEDDAIKCIHRLCEKLEKDIEEGAYSQNHRIRYRYHETELQD